MCALDVMSGLYIFQDERVVGFFAQSLLNKQCCLSSRPHWGMFGMGALFTLWVMVFSIIFIFMFFTPNTLNVESFKFIWKV